jgi:hypothetical protein
MASEDGSAAADAAKRALEQIERALIKQITALVSKLDTERGDSALLSDKEALANAAKIRSQIVRAMEEQALASIADATDKAALDAARAVADSLDMGDFNPDVVREIEGIINGQMAEVTDAFSKGADQIAEAMRLGVTTGDSLDSAIANVADAVHASFAKAQAAVDSAIMGAGRKVAVSDAQTAQDAAGEPMVMLYVGPSDQKTRPFCSEYVGKAVRLDDLGKLDNDTGLDAETFGGGYNCRHSWAAMLQSEAEAQGIEIVEV